MATVATGKGKGALLFMACAALGLLSGWGFTVDDALISAQVALHLAQGQGHRFSTQGPVVDCVTPLGWQWLLAMFAHTSSWRTLLVARWISAGCWLLATGLLGWCSARWVKGRRQVSLALLLGACLPLGAWAAAGMETGLVMLLCSIAMVSLFSADRGAQTPLTRDPLARAISSRQPFLRRKLAIGAAGLAAALRPELLPWALVLCASLPLLQRRATPAGLICTTLAVATPFLLVAVFRWHYFGRAAPLAAFAKPADLAFGLRYSIGGALLTGPLWLVFGRRRSGDKGEPPSDPFEPASQAVALSLGAHACSLALVGGDWMALYRLWVPVLPGAFLIASHRSRYRGASHWVRASICLACSVLLHLTLGVDARRVMGNRWQLIEAARSHLTSAARVASVDVGWLSAATNAQIVDLAGATDEQVALLPGGHTSKQLAADFLWRRNVDTLVLLAEEERLEEGRRRVTQQDPLAEPFRGRPLTWRGFRFARHVEEHLQRLEAADQFLHTATIPFGKDQAYHIFSRSLAASP